MAPSSTLKAQADFTGTCIPHALGLSYPMWWPLTVGGCINFFYPHPRMCLLILERGKGRQREKEISMQESNIDRLPPVCTPTRDRTPNLGMCSEWELNL